MAAPPDPNLRLWMWPRCCRSRVSVASLSPSSPRLRASPFIPLLWWNHKLFVARQPLSQDFPQWSFEGNKMLPQDTATRTGKGHGGRQAGRLWERGRKLLIQKSWYFGIKFLKFINSTKLNSDLVKINRENVRRCRRKLTLHMPQLHLLLLKLKSYLMMTEHPSWETAVFFKVAEPQGYANIW